MPSFTEEMQATTDRIRTAIGAREEDVARVKEDAKQLLSDARDVMAHTGRELQARARDVRLVLGDAQRQRQEQLREMRAYHQRKIRAMSDRLHETFRASRQNREEGVQEMLRSFGRARATRAEDYRQAARVWQELCS